MKLVAKFFEELSAKEIYEILRARAEIFVVEQKIHYNDIDGIDYKSLHIFFENDGRVEAYMRAYIFDDKDKAVKIGRVLTIEHGKGLGGKLLQAGIEIIKEKLGASKIIVDAQSYATGYYERAGFKICSDDFIEEGVLHKKMELII